MAAPAVPPSKLPAELVKESAVAYLLGRLPVLFRSPRSDVAS